MKFLSLGSYGKNVNVQKRVINAFWITFFFAITSISVIAQTCSGSLGAPIKTIDFGTGTGRSALSGLGVTTYKFNGNMNDGIHDDEYCISNNAGQHPPAWWYGRDHTGNTNGRMLIVNADDKSSGGEFYRITVNDLCRNTNFEFSAWIANILNPARGCRNSLPINVKFQIEDINGNIIGSNNTGNIYPDKDTLHWNRHNFSFSTGMNTSVVVVLKNNGIGGCGNDLAIDDISFAPCGPLLTFLPYTDKCTGESFTLTLNGAIPTYPSPRYQWQKSSDNGVTWTNIGTSTGSNTLTSTETVNGTIAKTVLFRALVAAEDASLNNVNCRVISPAAAIKINPLPVPAFTAQPAFCENKPIIFTATNTNVDYSWTFEQGNPATSTQANPSVTWTTAGTYSVNLAVVDKTTGCKSLPNSGSQPITINTNPNVSITSTGLDLCPGSSTTLTANSTNATSFQWSSNGAPISTNPSLIITAAGTYEVIVSNANGCTNSASVNVNAYPAIVASVTATPANCYGDSTGTAAVSTSGGTFQYSWKNAAGVIPNQTASSITKLPAGNYSVTITDANGCSVEKAVAITEPTPIKIDITTVSSSCSGTNGSATATATGGSGTYTYSWNTTPVQTTATANNLSAGTYTVTVNDGNTCAVKKEVIIGNVTGPSAQANVLKNITCYGASTGEATVVVNGGTAPFSYLWNTTPAATTQTVTGLRAGDYVVTVTDGNGCQTPAAVKITEPPAFLATVVVNQQVNCFGAASGEAVATGSGGNGGYQYSWNTSPVQTTPTITNLPAGTYVVTITDAAGCSVQNSVTITQPSATLEIDAIQLTHVKCFSDNSGSIEVAVKGGTGPYTYEWKNSGGILTQTGSKITGLPAGAYTCTITDANNCVVIKTETITQPAATFLATVNTTDATCFGEPTGSAAVTVTNGASPYTYEWKDGAGVLVGQTGATINNLPVGNYTVNVKDNNGCTVSKSFTISQPATGLQATVSAQNATCDKSNGAATVTVTGGTNNYTYLWNTLPAQTTATATNLNAGDYTVVITDANGCTVSKSVTIINVKGVAVTATTLNNVTCNGAQNGEASAIVNGGTAPFEYVWNTTPQKTTQTIKDLKAGSYTVTVKDANNCIATAIVQITEPLPLNLTVSAIKPITCYGDTTGEATVSATGGNNIYTYEWNTIPVQTSPTATNLKAGNYNVKVTDAQGCSTTTTVTITQPAKLASSITATAVKCFGDSSGSATANVLNGVAPLKYIWTSTNGTLSQTTATITNLKPGTYTLQVTDANGCSITDQTTITAPNASLAVDLTAKQASCSKNDGQITAIAKGGTLPYTYVWNTVPPQTTAIVTGLSAGNYLVLVTDANGCSTQQQIVITNPNNPTATVKIINTVTCFGQNNGTAAVENPKSSWTYTWNTNPVQTTATATNLAAGNYAVTIKDSNNCATVIPFTIDQPKNISVLIDPATTTHAGCSGGNKGEATAVATGGNPGGYQYVWSTNPVQTTATAKNLKAGLYTVTVKDSKGCEQKDSVKIIENNKLTASITATNLKCFGDNTGTATAQVSNGTAPLKYVWTSANGVLTQTTATITQLSSGTYTVTATDANGCSITGQISIAQPNSALTADLKPTQASCSKNDGQIIADIAGGTSPYSYLWNTSQTTKDIQGIPSGTYELTVTDANGCTAKKTVALVNPQKPIFKTAAVNDVTCFGDADGQAAVINPNSSWTYVWNTTPTQTTPIATNLKAGNYEVIVSDVSNCTATAIVEIKQPGPLVINFAALDNINCFGQNTGQVTAVVKGGNTGNYTYSWSTTPVQTTATINTLAAGTYTVTVKDSKGCVQKNTIDITQSEKLQASILSTIDLKCFEIPTGSATVQAIKGTAPYTYVWKNPQGGVLPNQVSSTAVGLEQGDYSVVVTDSKGCEHPPLAVTINQPQKINVQQVASTLASCGKADGTATVNATGGTGNTYYYTWNSSPIQTTATATNLAAGNYLVTVKDANGCSVIKAVGVSNFGGPKAEITVSKDIACNGQSTGEATVTVTNASGAISYSWNTIPVQTTATAINLTPGDYAVTVSDATNCKAAAVVTIKQSPLLVSTIASTKPLNCFGDATGEATVIVVGGTGKKTYTWSTSPIQTTATATGLVAGNYTVKVIDSLGCIAENTVSIQQPLAIKPEVAAKTDVKCFGDPTGYAVLNVTGGSPNYTYVWVSSTGVLTNQTSNTLAGVAAGSFTCTITDTKGCSSTITVKIEQATAALTTTVKPVTDVACFGSATGTATVEASNGKAPFSYKWQKQDGTYLPEKTATAANLPAGNYIVTVSDNNGCAVSQPVTIKQPAAELEAATTSKDGDCGLATASASVTITGGTAGYTYVWNTTPVQTTATATNLTSGAYTVKITDANGCTLIKPVNVSDANGPVAQLTVNSIRCYGDSTGEATVTTTAKNPKFIWSTVPAQTGSTAKNLKAGYYIVTVSDENNCKTALIVKIHQPQYPISAGFVINNPLNCFGDSTGSATVNVKGGNNSPYTYLWNTIPVQTTATAKNLKAGTYLVTITDSLGCISKASVDLTAGEEIIATATATDINCNGAKTGTIKVDATGGSKSYTYEWKTGAGVLLLQNGPIVTGLAAGQYICTITDGKNCKKIIPKEIKETALIDIERTVVNIKCFGEATGEIKITNTTGGTPSYTYKWNNGQTGTTISNLKEGVYQVTVTDASGCTRALPDVSIQAPLKLTAAFINTIPNPLNCAEDSTGNATVVALGGTPSYTYQWSNGITAAQLKGLKVGWYSVKITDANNCMYKDSLEITGPEKLVLNILKTQGTTCKFADGGASIKVTGGSPVYTYKWFPTGGADTIASKLTAGSYTVSVTDARGCVQSKTLVIPKGPSPVITFTKVTHVSCYKGTDGSATLNINLGTPPYQYSWLPGMQTTATIDQLAAGSYTAVVVDAKGCKDTAKISLHSPEVPDMFGDVTTSYCDGDSVIRLKAPIGKAPFQWYLNGVKIEGATDSILKIKNPINVTNYSVTFYIKSCMNKNAGIIATTLPTQFEPDSVANVFTPDNSGPNNVFYPYFSRIYTKEQIQYYGKEFSFRVFDRWGKLMYEGNSADASWDGTYKGIQAKEGVYYWMATYTSRCGSADKKVENKGFVHLIR